MNFRKTFLQRVSTKALYLTAFIALVAIAALGLASVPDFTGTSKASTLEKVAQAEGDEIATPEMLAYALNFKSAAGFETLAANSDDVSATTRKELADTFSAINQLPCTELKSSQLGGKSFAAGVYCLDSAELAGQMTLDGENNGSAIFVFRVRGDFAAKSGASVVLGGMAQAANVFFVAGDEATINEGVEFKGNLIARNNIDVDNASSVKGRTISVEGKVNGAAVSNLGGGTGTVQICKAVFTPTGGTDITNRIFRFTVSGVAGVQEVRAGTCGSPIDVPVGPQTITELTTGRFTNLPGEFNGGFQLINVEQLSTNPSTQGAGGVTVPGSSLGVVNLGTQVANISVAEGGQEAALIIRFTNQFAITGFIEICKQRAVGPSAATVPTAPAVAGGPLFGFSGTQTFNPGSTTAPIGGGDPDVTGFFNFTVENVFSLNQINAPGSPTPPGAVTRTLQVFTVPVGQCSGPIQVTISNPTPTTTAPRESRVRVTELARPGFFLESVTTRPTFDREVGANPATGAGGEVLGCRVVPSTSVVSAQDAAGGGAPRGTVVCDNVGGGFTEVRVIEGSAVMETIVDFFNRSNPGLVKVCKIAGPGIPEGTLFRFSVGGPFGTTGFGARPTAAGGTTTANNTFPQFATFGPVSTVVDVPAGPAATGGNCVLVPGLGAGFNNSEFQTFVNGTPVLVVENGISPANTTIVPAGAIRTSRIRVLGPATGTTLLPGAAASGSQAGRAGFSPNPDTTPCLAPNSPAACTDTNFDGRTSQVGTASTATSTPGAVFTPGTAAFTFAPRIGRVAFNQRPGEVVAEFTNFIFNPTILKICKVVTGSLAPNTTSFNFAVTLTNGGPTGLGGALFPGNPTANVSVIGGAGTAANPSGNCAVVDGSNFPGGSFNIGEPITVTEATATGTTLVRCDSETNGGFLTPAGGVVPAGSRTCGFTQGGVVAGVNVIRFTNGPTVPGNEESVARTAFDFDGDGKADPSIFTPSTGTWSYASSAANGAVRTARWGMEGDKPVAADFDGDKKTDFAVYRGGNWYIMNSATGAASSIQFGLPTDVPQVGDYDGDGRADAAVFRPSNGTWYMLGSSKGFSAVQFGVATDKPIAADYDGDGKMDQAVFRGGAWYINKSRDGFSGANWGLATDVPVPADYNGDRKADISVFRGGMWYTLKADGTMNAASWGLATDKPVPADYDGDSKADITVYRNGMWFSLPTTTTAAGYESIQLGTASDMPIPAR